MSVKCHDITDEELMEKAVKARKHSYCPYSHYAVGAALLTSDGKIYTGCNIENASFSPTNCAERTAFFKAVSEGKRNFTAIAVSGGPEGSLSSGCTPCGVCRQVMSEFCGEDFKIILGIPGNLRTVSLADLLPGSFGSSEIGI